MACRFLGAKPLPETVLTYCYLEHMIKLQGNFNKDTAICHRKNIWKCILENGEHFLPVLIYKRRNSNKQLCWGIK